MSRKLGKTFGDHGLVKTHARGEFVFESKRQFLINEEEYSEVRPKF